MSGRPGAEGVVLTGEELRRRRSRSLAIGLGLAALVALFYVVTIVKMGAAVAERTL